MIFEAPKELIDEPCPALFLLELTDGRQVVGQVQEAVFCGIPGIRVYAPYVNGESAGWSFIPEMSVARVVLVPQHRELEVQHWPGSPTTFPYVTHFVSDDEDFDDPFRLGCDCEDDT